MSFSCRKLHGFKKGGASTKRTAIIDDSFFSSIKVVTSEIFHGKIVFLPAHMQWLLERVGDE